MTALGCDEGVALLGGRFHPVTEEEAAAKIFDWTAAPDGRTRIIVTVNVAILMMLRADPALRAAAERADLTLVDGMPLVWASRWLGRALPERVTGADLMERLLAGRGTTPLRVYLLGSTPERLRKLVEVIGRCFPNVVIVGARDGYFQRDRSAEVVEDIRCSRADLLLVGMPAPFKEIWCERWRDALQTPVVLGVGGAFDVMAGFVPRAPKALQKAGLEWAWRLAQEPRKLWKRYLVTNAQFIALLGAELAKRPARRSGRQA